MTVRQTILAHVIAIVGCHVGLARQPAADQPAPAPPIALPAPPYLQPSAVVQPAPPIAPIYPPPSAVPMPSHTPGLLFGPPGAEVAPVVGNPIAVPVLDEELAWDQIADVVSDYFMISREVRARRSGEVWVEGRIETAPQDGATWLEPHRGDSVGAFNRWESTFQTIRRRAVVRVIPDAAGYLVEVVVEKELEDLPSPEKATAGVATFRSPAGSLPSRRLEQASRTRSAPRWIQLGRDPPLEQRMLADIHARLIGVATAGSVFAP